MQDRRTIWTGNEHIQLVDLKLGDVVGRGQPPMRECVIPIGPPCWHVLTVAPNTEASTADRLKEGGFRSRAFNVWRREPTGKRDQFGRRETVERERPMFPGYVFCDLRPGLHDFNKARKVKGARDFLRDEGGWPVSMSADLVNMMQDREAFERERYLESIGPKAKRRPDLAIGQDVRVTSGHLAEFSAQITKLDDKGRVQLLLSMFGQYTKAWVDGDQLEKV